MTPENRDKEQERLSREELNPQERDNRNWWEDFKSAEQSSGEPIRS
jgi:hypothetical protein